MADALTIQRKMFDVIANRDFAGLRDLYHPDYTYTDSEGERAGADAGVAVAEMYVTAFPDLDFEIRHAWGAGDDVAVLEFTVRGTHQGDLGDIAPTGRTVEAAVCNVVEVRDGKILREREYFDSLAIMRQLGVMD